MYVRVGVVISSFHSTSDGGIKIFESHRSKGPVLKRLLGTQQVMVNTALSIPGKRAGKGVIPGCSSVWAEGYTVRVVCVMSRWSHEWPIQKFE